MMIGNDEKKGHHVSIFMKIQEILPMLVKLCTLYVTNQES